MDPTVRRHEHNRIMGNIRNIDMAIDTDEAAILRMKHQTQTSFTRSQINKMIQKNIERKEAREELTDRLKKLDSGLLDDELRERIKQQMKEAQEKTRITQQRKKAVAANKEAQSVISKAYYQASRDADRKNRYLKRNIDRSYRHFTKACNSIPDYIIRNLSSMPNNKGYIWKSVACYGELPSEPGQPTVLFDRRRGGIMVIHEWTKDEYRKYEKKGKDRKVLVHTATRRQRQLPPVCPEIQQREEDERRANNSRRSSGRKYSSDRKRRSREKNPRNKTKSRVAQKTTKPLNTKKYGRGTGSKWQTKI